MIPQLSICRFAGGNRCSFRDVTLSPCCSTNRESRGTQSCFLLMAASDTSQQMTSSHLHMYPSANLHKSNGPVSPEPRVADGTAVHVRSPRSRKCLLPCNLDRRPGSCLVVDGHWRCWPDILATSLVCLEYRRRLSRSHPLSGGISLPLVLPAVPQRSRAPLPAAVSRACAR